MTDMTVLQHRPEAWVVAEVGDRAGFLALSEEWNRLVRETDDQLFYRHEFIRIWLDHFAAHARLRVLTCRDERGELTAVLPLIEEKTTMYGVPVRQLLSASNAHSCRFDLIARDPFPAAERFFAHLAADDGWDLLRLGDVPDSGRAIALQRVAEAAGWPTGSWASLRSPYLPLPRSAEVLEQSLSSGFRKSLRRRHARLSERGPLAVERVSTREGLDAKLATAFALEASGWKGENGTAIAQDPRTLGFYTDLARFGADEGTLSLYFLGVAGQTIAFDLAFSYAGRYLTLKPGYDEAFATYSPGQLLTLESLRDAIARGLNEFDLLGDEMPCKREWTRQVRPHAWLFVFRNNGLGRLLCKTKFNWMPTAREVVARFRG